MHLKSVFFLVDTQSNLNAHKPFKRRTEHHMNVLYKFNIGRVSTGLVELMKLDALRDCEIFR